ncbi:nucleotidyltransferase family protein [Novosphingobium sp. MMS21-SN21R]|uniref:nucleotidyltransferase family protein n=1 Tax=Novosphingobium sp. MMS21-SN21R TaxID=2969298 RepID=UPI00288604F3|nr:nucleotidyltransferase family protein [Novosphingobium sp. MMS21-SN21R]MDT0508322.1 nucleotidyltransferase family protein [Novosphingobium sp. MMS21-SN21R]
MTALLLLAAGRGTRFGGDKLAAPLDGRSLAQHAANNLAALPFTRRIAVCSVQTPALPGFERVLLDPSGAPLSRSISLGIAALKGEQAVLIALADMPLVPPSHFAALIAHFRGDRTGTRVGNLIMVPAIFGAAHFQALTALSGDKGAGAMLRDAPAVELEPSLALDVDTPEDLHRASALLQGR